MQIRNVEPQHEMYLNGKITSDRALNDLVEPQHEMYLNPWKTTKQISTNGWTSTWDVFK